MSAVDLGAVGATTPTDGDVDAAALPPEVAGEAAADALWLLLTTS